MMVGPKDILKTDYDLASAVVPPYTECMDYQA